MQYIKNFTPDNTLEILYILNNNISKSNDILISYISNIKNIDQLIPIVICLRYGINYDEIDIFKSDIIKNNNNEEFVINSKKIANEIINYIKENNYKNNNININTLNTLYIIFLLYFLLKDINKKKLHEDYKLIKIIFSITKISQEDLVRISVLLNDPFLIKETIAYNIHINKNNDNIKYTNILYNYVSITESIRYHSNKILYNKIKNILENNNNNTLSEDYLIIAIQYLNINAYEIFINFGISVSYKVYNYLLMEIHKYIIKYSINKKRKYTLACIQLKEMLILSYIYGYRLEKNQFKLLKDIDYSLYKEIKEKFRIPNWLYLLKTNNVQFISYLTKKHLKENITYNNLYKNNKLQKYFYISLYKHILIYNILYNNYDINYKNNNTLYSNIVHIINKYYNLKDFKNISSYIEFHTLYDHDIILTSNILEAAIDNKINYNTKDNINISESELKEIIIHRNSIKRLGLLKNIQKIDLDLLNFNGLYYSYNLSLKDLCDNLPDNNKNIKYNIDYLKNIINNLEITNLNINAIKNIDISEKIKYKIYEHLILNELKKYPSKLYIL